MRRTRDGALHPSFNTPPNVLDGQRNNYDGDNVDYRAAAQYRWNDDVMTYLQYSTGFKGGGTTPRPFNLQQVLAFGPEKLKTWEVGTKTDLFDRRLRLNGAVFYSDYADVQLGLQQCPLGPPVPCGVIANAGDAKMKGVELEATFRPVSRWLIDTSYSYTDFEWKRLAPQVLTATGAGIQLSMTAPFMPKTKASVGTQYEFSLANGSTIVPRVDASFQSQLFTNGNNSVNNRIGGYTLFNARLTWKNAEGDLEASLEGTNLGDKYYFLSRADQYTGAGHTDGAPGRPREFALTIKKKF